MEIWLGYMNEIVWGIPVLGMILLVGIIFTIKTGFIQIQLLPRAVKRLVMSIKGKNSDDGDNSGYRALCTALAATVGTGNIAGVAGAMAIGGPGVIFWMWICALLGMITKMAEVTLAIHYRRKNTTGEYIGGPMYMIIQGLPTQYHILAYIYAFFGIVASFGVGNATQINTVVGGLKSIALMAHYKLNWRVTLFIGVILAILILKIFSKGARGIGSWAVKLVPFAAGIYILLSILVLIICFDKLPFAFSTILTAAFQPKSITCGMIESAFLTLRVGISRGVFTNEAGMGTASIAHATAKTKQPVQQGMMGIIEVFLDTIVICTLTALVILCSDTPITYGTDPGIILTLDAFSNIFGPWIRILITILVCLFAFATILGWGLYGARCAQFIFGDRAWKVYVWAQAFVVFVSVLLNTSVVWALAELLNGLMALPNLVALILLSPDFYHLISDYSKKENAHRR